MMPNCGFPSETLAPKGEDDKKQEIEKKQSTQESSSSGSRNVSTKKVFGPSRTQVSLTRSFHSSFQNRITLDDIEKQNYMRHELRLRDRVVTSMFNAADPTYEEDMKSRRKLEKVRKHYYEQMYGPGSYRWPIVEEPDDSDSDSDY